MSNSVIIDTDPGIDDSIALYVAHKLFGSKILGMIASFGNLPLSTTESNLKNLSKLYKIDCPLYSGANKPMKRDFQTAANIHGDNGIGGIELEKSNAHLGSLSDLAQAILLQDKTDYIVLGPMTNLAMLLKDYPQIKSHIGKVVVMGGGIIEHNMPGHSEFNFHCDPYSADFVVNSGLDVAVIPLDVTSKVYFDYEQIDLLFKPDSDIKSVINSMLKFCHKTNTEFGEAGAVMHDATAVIYYHLPKLFYMINSGLNVSEDNDSYGKCILNNNSDNVKFGAYSDADKVKDMIVNAIIK
ncbi:MAG: nucleoside hydrolase [Oscillospiraceae bacterium]|nr:nucleoside hydrolase [Oscillospiraceae bacterium]